MANPTAVEQLKRVDSYDRLSWRTKGLYALTILSLLLAACQRAGVTSRAPGVTEAIPTPTTEFTPVPVEVPPTAAAAPATATEAVFAGGGNPPLCDALLTPFIPGEEATQDPDGVWIDSRGNPIVDQDGRPVDVDGTLLGISQLAEEGTILTVETAGIDNEYRWFVKPTDGNKRPLWMGELNGDPFLDHPNLMPSGRQLVLNPLPNPGVGGEIRFGVSGGEVTAAVIGNGQAALCFNPVTNEWFIPDSGGRDAAETPIPPATSTPGLSTPKPDADPQDLLLTELASDRATPEQPTAVPPTATERPTVVAPPAENPVVVQPPTLPEPSPTPTPEATMSPELQELVTLGWPATTQIENGRAHVVVDHPLPIGSPKGAIAIADCRNPTPRGGCRFVQELVNVEYETVEQAWQATIRYLENRGEIARLTIAYVGDLNWPENDHVVAAGIGIHSP